MSSKKPEKDTVSKMSDHKKHLFCSKCCLQFKSDSVFGLHVSLVHKRMKEADKPLASENLDTNSPLESNFDDENVSS